MKQRLKLAAIFQDDMVIQRGRPTAIWGWGLPGKEVCVSIQGKKCVGRVDEGGTWRIWMAPLEQSGDETLCIVCGRETIQISHVAVGEVWIASGQSNMEFVMKYDAGYEEELEQCPTPGIRFFDVPKVAYEREWEEKDFSCYGFWRRCDRENLKYFSAVAYYFARKISSVCGCVVGVIGCTWGGTPCCAWMDSSYLGEEGAIWMEEYEERVKQTDQKKAEVSYRNSRPHRITPFDTVSEALLPGATREEMEAFIAGMDAAAVENGRLAEGFWLSHRRPGGLYETMVKSILPYTVQGVLWYQGESDSPHPEKYGFLLRQMIRCWRQGWGEEVPFLVAQLAPLEQWGVEKGDTYGRIRREQEKVAESMDRVWLVSTSDCGMQWDIHPKKKQPVGERFAMLARGHIYGEDILCDAPKLLRYGWEGDTIRLTFSHAEGGLRWEKSRCLPLEVRSGGRKRMDIIKTIQVQDTHIALQLSDGGEKEVEIRFASQPYFEVNLYNKSGIPALPFEVLCRKTERTDGEEAGNG